MKTKQKKKKKKERKRIGVETKETKNPEENLLKPVFMPAYTCQFVTQDRECALVLTQMVLHVCENSQSVQEHALLRPQGGAPRLKPNSELRKATWHRGEMSLLT
jgi:hypothetical protein